MTVSIYRNLISKITILNSCRIQHFIITFKKYISSRIPSMVETTFYKVDEKVEFPKEEEKILKYWADIDAFKTSVKLSEGRPAFIFFDGPPFATGLPHYGHLLAGSIKDVVTRYAYQCGYYVERRFGWDCHGLPIEHEIDKMNGIKHLDEVYKMGIGVYNEKCREVVMRYANEWRVIVSRSGRWIDFDNDYKTLNTTYMETLWWIFRQLYEKGLVYRGFQVMPYSLSCSTPVSNFEANLNYKTVTDPALFVSFKCLDDDMELVAWTTTPWTLPSNLALCVNEEFKYLKLKSEKTSSIIVIAECRLDYFTQTTKLKVQKVGEIMGKDLIGKKYKPLFDYFIQDPIFDEEQLSRSYVVVADKMVTHDTGTGIVHCAPYYGEEDLKVCKKHRIVVGCLPNLLDDSGHFKECVADLRGMYIKDADIVIKRMLKERGCLVHADTVVHSYPFCWRSDTPLIYRAVNSWFIRIEDYRKDILRCSEKTNWVPKYIRDGRFHNWINDARDWCIGRNRFWGTPIPIWASEDYSQLVCVGSIEELEKLSNRKVTDLHRHYVDDILIPDPRGDGYPPLKRIPEIFDCWYESGSMPFAKIHYPFEHKDELRDHFPANFIAEGLDQTRGWFYTLMVISTYIFNEPAFKNVIVNGLILASDGKKMSKRLKNYPDPMEIINLYGADSLRLFLISSPAAKSEPVRFSEQAVCGILKDVILPWFHSYRFLVQEVSRYEMVSGKRFVPDSSVSMTSSCIMDRWIYSITHKLIKNVHCEMKQYKLYKVIPKLLSFLEQLTNWYIRINRDRMRGTFGEEDSLISLRTLYESLKIFTHLMSIFAPFTSEMIYQNLKRAVGGMDSVHYEMLPTTMEECDEAFIGRIDTMQQVILLGRTVRERKRVPLKSAIKSLTVIHEDESVLSSLEDLIPLIKDELNVVSVELSSDKSCLSTIVVPNFKVLGSRLGSDMQRVGDVIKKLTDADIKSLENNSMDIFGHEISIDDVVVSVKLNFDNLNNTNLDGDSNKNIAVVLDFTPDDSLQHMSLAREVINRIQKIRKMLKLSIDDDITIHIEPQGDDFIENIEYLEKTLRKPVNVSKSVNVANFIHMEDVAIKNVRFKVFIVRN